MSAVFLLTAFSACSKNSDEENAATTALSETASQSAAGDENTDSTTAQPEEFTTFSSVNSQTDVVADGWLKILSITQYNGALAVLAQNVSDSDVEYALLTVKADNETLSFNVSALLHGETALLICNEKAVCDADCVYSFWQTENKTEFSFPVVMNDDKISVSVSDGSISVENISGADIENEIFIYYKEKINNTLNGSITRRFRVAPLKSDAKTFINTDSINEDNCKVIFTQF